MVLDTILYLSSHALHEEGVSFTTPLLLFYYFFITFLSLFCFFFIYYFITFLSLFYHYFFIFFNHSFSIFLLFLFIYYLFIIFFLFFYIVLSFFYHFFLIIFYYYFIIFRYYVWREVQLKSPGFETLTTKANKSTSPPRQISFPLSPFFLFQHFYSQSIFRLSVFI